MKQDYIVFGAGHDGSIFSLTANLPEIPVLPSPCVYHRSDKVDPKILKIFEVVKMEYKGRIYNVASDTIVAKEFLARVIEEKRPAHVE